MMRRVVFLSLALCMLICVAPAQTLTTTFANNNGQSGNMFDVDAFTDVTVNDFDCNLDSGSWNVEVYVVTGGGSWSGNETNSSAWTLLATATVIGAGPGSPTNLGLNLGYTVANGTTQGFYITCNNGTGMNYTNGNAVGAVAAGNADCQILEGLGKSYAFAGSFMPRIWNGTMHYTTGPPPILFVATTTGVGDLTLSGPADPPGTTEGFILLSQNLSGPVGQGPFLGLNPDALTFAILSFPAAVGDILHYLPDANSFPNVPVSFPAGSFSSLIGQSYDGVLVQVINGVTLDVSNVARITF